MRTVILCNWWALATCAWLQVAQAEAAPVAPVAADTPLVVDAPLAAEAAGSAGPQSSAGTAPLAGGKAAREGAGAPFSSSFSLPFGSPFGLPVGSAQLEQLRGGTDTVWNDMQLSGTVANNSAINVVSGTNIVSDGAFSNASGLPMVIQNSGSNVLIQSATIINVQFK